MRKYNESDVIFWDKSLEDLRNRYDIGIKKQYNTWIRYKCELCGKEAVKTVYSILHTINGFYCHSCALKNKHAEHYGSEEAFQKIQLEKRTKTNIERYGVVNVYQNEAIKEKIKATNLERYGVTSGGNTPEGRAKAKETYFKKTGYYCPTSNPVIMERAKRKSLEKYGTPYPGQSRVVRDKIENTCKDKYGGKSSLCSKDVRDKSKETIKRIYGVDNVSKSELIKAKKVETCRRHYGVEYPSQSEEIMSKYRQKCLDKYGTEYALQAEEVKDKIKATCMKKYGYEWTSLVPEIRAKQIPFCKVNGVKFDSLWEVYVYFYFLRNNIPFEYQVPIEYVINDKRHYYYCDFKRLDTGELLEVKNPACLDDDGNVIQLYTKGISDDEILRRQIILDGKNRCMKENNVKLITDISPYKRWFKEHCDDVVIER